MRSRRRRYLESNQITGPIPPEIGKLTALKLLRVPPASPTPGAPRDRPSASQGPQQQQDRRPGPDRDRPAHGAGGAASSPRVPDGRRGARPPLGVAGTSTTTTRSPARSRSPSATSRLATPRAATTSSRRAARRAAALLTKLRPARPPSPGSRPRPCPRRATTAGLTAARRVALAATAVLAGSAVAVVKITSKAAAMDSRAFTTNTRASACQPRASTAGIPAARRVALATTAVMAECAVAVVKITSKAAATGRLASTLTTRAFSPAAIPRVPRAKQARPSN